MSVKAFAWIYIYISDKKLTRRNGLLHLLESGDSVVADHGFDIQINIPPFLKGKSQMDEQEMIQTRKIASFRIHVE